MKILYAVLPGYQYEGFGEPDAVFTDKEKAEAFAEKMRARGPSHADWIEVVEVTLDPEE